MPTPDASAYTRVKRLQSIITQNFNTIRRSTYSLGMSSLSYSLPNVLLSNKFLNRQIRLVDIIKQIIQNIQNINTSISQGIAARLITQGAANRAKQYILSGGSASTTEFYIILSGGTS